MAAQAESYRNAWAHNKLQVGVRDEFLDQLLTNKVIHPSASHLNLKTILRRQLQYLIPKIQSQKTQVGGTQNTTVLESVDLDDRIYSAVVKALVEFRKEDQKNENQPSDRAMTVIPAFPPVSKDAQFLCDVFVIMPFAPDFLTVFTDIIEPVCEGLGLKAKRGDNFQSNDHVIFGFGMR